MNFAMRIDTRLTNPLASLPPSTFGGADDVGCSRDQASSVEPES